MKILRGFKQTDIGIIPEDWEAIPLGELFDFKNGLNKEKRYFGYGTPIVNYMDVYRNRALTESDILGKVFLSKQEIKNYEAKQGDVFFTRTSETVQEVGISSVVLGPLKDTVFSGFVLRARPKNDKLDDRYKKYCFSSTGVRKEIVSNSTYTTRALTNGKALSKVKILVPPIKEEQTAIANVLSETDSFIFSLEKLIAKKQNIKQAAMQKLLSPQKNWEAKTYGEIFTFLNTATYSRAELSEGEEVSYVHYGDIHTQWTNLLDFNFAKLPTISSEKLKNYQLLQEGDLIMADASEDYSGIGKCVEVKNLYNRKAISGLHTFLLRDTKGVFVNGYKGYLHESKYIKNQFDKLATGMKVYGVSKNNLKQVHVSVPPKPEQDRIVTILTEIDFEIKGLKKKLTKYKVMKQGMLQNLLTGRVRLLNHK